MSALRISARAKVDRGSLLFAVCVSATSYALLLSGENLTRMFLAQAIVMLFPVLALLLVREYRRFSRRNIVVWFAIAVVLLATVLLNMNSYRSGTYPVEYVAVRSLGVVSVMFSIQWAATNLRPMNIFRYSAGILWPLVLTGVLVSLAEGGLLVRHSPFGAHPNHWGGVGFALVITSLATRNAVSRAVFIGTAFVLFVLVESRGALVAALASVFMYGLASVRFKRISVLKSALILSAGLLGALVLPMQHFFNVIVRFVSDDVLLLKDPDRGVGSGLTGRLDGWVEAIEMFSSNPFFGQGLDTLASVHNGFLRLLGENGLVLTLLIFLAAMQIVFQALRERNYLPLCILGGITVFLVTYPMMLNLNLVALLAYFFLFQWRSARLDDYSESWLRHENFVVSGGGKYRLVTNASSSSKQSRLPIGATAS